MIDLIWRELETPTGQTGPLARAMLVGLVYTT